MKSIRRNFIYSMTGLIICLFIVIWFLYTKSWSAALLVVVGIIALTAITFQIWINYKNAKLICDNPIIKVDVASICETDCDEKNENSVNVVVSGFGILLGSKPYKFGYDGIRLMDALVDNEVITFWFGNDCRKYTVKLLHGIANIDDMRSFIDRLKYETGVEARIE